MADHPYQRSDPYAPRPSGDASGFRGRRDSIQSTSSIASFYSDVEFAQDEVFAGPTSESLPTSAASFQHRRRPRTESQTSWAFYEQPVLEENGVAQDEDAIYFDDDLESARSVYEAEEEDEDDRISLNLKRQQSNEPLLRRERHSSSGGGRTHHGASQKVYIESEDLTIVITGFTTSWWKYWVYIFLCTATLGLGWLLFRWFPRWRVSLTAKQAKLGDCDWVVIENQWNEFVKLDVKRRQYGMQLSTIFGLRAQVSSTFGYDDDDPTVNNLRYIDYRYLRFIYNPLYRKFMLNNHWKDPDWTSMRALRTGIDGESKTHRNLVFGDNVMEIDEKTIPQLLVDEAFHPFYVFQIASLILWSMDEYYYYAVCIFLISGFSIASTLIETKTAMRRLREVSRFICDVRVLRNGFWRYVPSTDLVPGDVYEVTDPGLTLYPCDSLLLTGDCIVNESMLTGESVPVSKSPCDKSTVGLMDLGQSSMHPAVTRHFLYCGTKIIRARRPQDKGDDEPAALALVVRTGFNTTKGSLVRSMLFPKPSGFKFYRDSFYYIAVMAGIAALGFIASLINFIRLGLPAHLIVVRALDLITIVVPPALPATLTIGTSFALSRLRNRNIFCISPQRVNVSGKLDVVAFDKTGTLTEDGLDVLGVHAVHTSTNKFSVLHEEPNSMVDLAMPEDRSLFKSLFHTMTTCHSLRLVDGELLGDPLDLKMFEFTDWAFEEGEGGSDDPNAVGSGLSPSTVHAKGETEAELGIMKSFDFDAALRRTSVIVKRYKATGGDIYVKGAPECMKEICDVSTFPADFDEILDHYTHSGYRVIACATRHIKNLSWIKSQKMKRTEAESGLTFAGFIIFENKLKPETTAVLQELREANIRTVMCTGDNILTAISVAKNCTLITSPVVFVPSFSVGDSSDPDARVRWQTTSDPPILLDEDTLLPIAPHAEGPYDTHDLHTYTLAVTGDMFRWIVDFAPEDYLHRMLIRAAIFARMSPDEKHELVEKLQSIDYTVGFCGDGANDCGALKAADVGVSLSEAEASVAAPFTSRTFNISCVPQVIREGRAALVTSFSCFKYMSLYSAIQFTSVSILYKFGSNLGDFQFLFIDLFLILPIAVFMGWSGPYPTLARKGPTASLVSRKVLVPLLGQIAFAASLQFLAFELVQTQSWYIPPPLGEDKSLLSSSPNTTLFLYSCYQYIFASVVLSVGKPYRMGMSNNWPYCCTIAIGLVVASVMLWACPEWLSTVMQLTKMGAGFKGVLMILAVVHLGGAWWGEQYALPALAKGLGKALAWVHGKGEGAKKKKIWKVLESEMRI